MTLATFGAFCAASFLLGIAPGPDNLFVCSQAALYGVRCGITVVLGLCAGLVLQTLAAALGVAAVVAGFVLGRAALGCRLSFVSGGDGLAPPL